MQDFYEFCGRDGLTPAYARTHRGIGSHRAAFVEALHKTFPIVAAKALAPSAEVIANQLLSRARLRLAA
jgi:hypothetical protein